MRPADLAAEETTAFVLTHLPDAPVRILDVGCGTGEIARRLQKQGYEVVAVDSSEERVEQARALGVDARVAAWPDFEDEPFDVVLFSRSLHHIEPLKEAVEQAHKLLKPGGTVLVDDFAWADIDPATGEWFYGVVRLLDACGALHAEEGFTYDLAQSGGRFEFWQESRAGHDFHTVEAMWDALGKHFDKVVDASSPRLYRHLRPALTDDDSGTEIMLRVREMEERLGELGTVRWIGRQFVGRKRGE